MGEGAPSTHSTRGKYWNRSHWAKSRLTLQKQGLQESLQQRRASSKGRATQNGARASNLSIFLTARRPQPSTCLWSLTRPYCHALASGTQRPQLSSIHQQELPSLFCLCTPHAAWGSQGLPFCLCFFLSLSDMIILLPNSIEWFGSWP